MDITPEEREARKAREPAIRQQFVARGVQVSPVVVAACAALETAVERAEFVDLHVAASRGTVPV